jgi:hypothetical protein
MGGDRDRGQARRAAIIRSALVLGAAETLPVEQLGNDAALRRFGAERTGLDEETIEYYMHGHFRLSDHITLLMTQLKVDPELRAEMYGLCGYTDPVKRKEREALDREIDRELRQLGRENSPA